jgi:anti-anti-sigma factor
MHLSVTERAVDGDTILLVAVGEVDVRSCGLLRDAMAHALTDGGPAPKRLARVLVDLSAVSFCDCVGIGVLVAARTAAAERRVALRVVNPQRQVRRVLHLSGVLGTLAG